MDRSVNASPLAGTATPDDAGASSGDDGRAIKAAAASELAATWTPEVEQFLRVIQAHCIDCEKKHRKRYFILQSRLKYFRIPTIVLSGVNSVCSVGLQAYLPQRTISMLTCVLALVCGIITSVELYLQIQMSMENALCAAKDFSLLGAGIFKTTTLRRSRRGVDGGIYAEDVFGAFCKIYENSQLLDQRFHNAMRLDYLTQGGIGAGTGMGAGIGSGPAAGVLPLLGYEDASWSSRFRSSRTSASCSGSTSGGDDRRSSRTGVSESESETTDSNSNANANANTRVGVDGSMRRPFGRNRLAEMLRQIPTSSSGSDTAAPRTSRIMDFMFAPPAAGTRPAKSSLRRTSLYRAADIATADIADADDEEEEAVAPSRAPPPRSRAHHHQQVMDSLQRIRDSVPIVPEFVVGEEARDIESGPCPGPSE